MARTRLRYTAAVGALGLGLLAMSPAACRHRQPGRRQRLHDQVADQDGQGTGTVDGEVRERQGDQDRRHKPAFPQPAQDTSRPASWPGGHCRLRGTRRPAPDWAVSGKGQITIGDGSCLVPGNVLTGSLSTFDLDHLLSTNSASAVTDALKQVPGSQQVARTSLRWRRPPSRRRPDRARPASAQFGDSGLVVDLGMIEGRCTAGDGRPHRLLHADQRQIAPQGAGGQDDHPAGPSRPTRHPNTHLTTTSARWSSSILDAVKTDLQSRWEARAARSRA